MSNTREIDCRTFGRAATDDLYCCYECTDGSYSSSYSYAYNDYKSYGANGRCYHPTARTCAVYQKYVPADPGARRLQLKASKANEGAGVTYSAAVSPSGGANNYCVMCPAGTQAATGTSGQSQSCYLCDSGYFRKGGSTNGCVSNIPCENYGAGFITASPDTDRTRPNVCKCDVGYHFPSYFAAYSAGIQYSFSNDIFLWYSSTFQYGSSVLTGSVQGCVRCPAGYTTTAEGKQTCEPLDLVWNGYYYDYDTNGKKQCPAGTYQPTATFATDSARDEFFAEGINACIKCAAGTSKANAGATSCEECDPGQYQDETGQISCKPARMGKYAEGNGNTIDTDCRMGTYSDTEGLSQCKNTVAGEYQDQVGQIGPKFCATGTYSSEIKSITCKAHSECAFSSGNDQYDVDSYNYTIVAGIDLDDYRQQYEGWLQLTQASVSTFEAGTTTHDTICQCNPGFYFAASRDVDEFFTTPFADHAEYVTWMKTRPQQPRVPCWPVTPGFYTDTYNAINQIPYKDCSESDSLEVYGPAYTFEQRKCRCVAGYYRDTGTGTGGTGITYNGDSIDVCTRATLGVNYVPTAGCSGGTNCKLSVHTCTGQGLTLRTAATIVADVKCRCNTGYYRPQGGDYLAYNVACTAADITNNEFVDQMGQTKVKISIPCKTYNEDGTDSNGHVEFQALTATQNRRCQCARGFFRDGSGGATHLIAPWTRIGQTTITYPTPNFECRRPGETNNIKNGFVDQEGQTAITPYTACKLPSTTEATDALSYYHDRKCQCQRGYYRTNGNSFFAGLTCAKSEVGYVVPTLGSSTRKLCGRDTDVAANGQPGFCPYDVNSVAIPYPTCYDSVERPTVAALDNTRTKSFAGKCRCRRGYYKPGDGGSFNYFKQDGTFLDTLPVCTAASRGYKVPNDGSTSQTACIDEQNYQPLTGQTTCNDLPDCPESTVNDPANTNTIHGRRCQCDIGYYDTKESGGNNLQPSYVCKRPCAGFTVTCRHYLPPNMLGANTGNLLETTPCNEGKNLVQQTDRTYTSGYICQCKSDSYRTEGHLNLIAGTHTCTPHETCASRSVQKTAPTYTAQRICECDSDSYNTAIGNGFDAPGTGICQPRSECASVTTLQIYAGSSTSNTRCKCASGYYNENTGLGFEAPGNNICGEKGTCVTPSTEVHVEGGPTIDRTCQCKSGYYHLGSHLNLAPGTLCYEQNTCNSTTSTLVQPATETSDEQCTCREGYFRTGGDTFFITSCPPVSGACQEQSCTEVGQCATPSTIQYGALTGTEDRKCQCAPGYYNPNGGTDLSPGTTCTIADVSKGEYVPNAGSSSPSIMNPCPPSTEVDSSGSSTAERTCRCLPGFYRTGAASNLPTSQNCTAVGEGFFTASHSATEREPHRACLASTVEFTPPTSTSQRRCQCDRGYYKSSGATDLSVDETCTAATPGYFVSEIGSTSQEQWHECGSTLVVQTDGTLVSDVVCKCAPQHFATQWENLAWDGSCTARSACEGSLTYMMVNGVFVEPPGDSDSLCMCNDGFYLPDPFNLPHTATCLENGVCNNTLQMYQLGDLENPTLCKCAPGYYVDLVTHHRKHALMELSFESGSSVQDSFLGHVFTLNSLIDLANPTPASFTTGRVGQYSLDFSGNEIYYLSQNHNFYRAGIDGITLSLHVKLNSATMMQLVMDLSAFRVILIPKVNIFSKVEYSGGVLNVGLPTNTFTEVGVWHHLAVVFDYSNHFISGYINGSYAGGVRDWNLNDAFLSSGPISIGGLYGDDLYKSFDGKLDDVRFFSDVLTESEIGTLANYKQKDVFLDIPTDKSWFSGLPTTSECALMSTCHSSAMSMWPDPANPSDFDTFGDTLCTCKPGFYRPVFASNFDSLTECIEAPSGYFVASSNQTSYEEWGECGVGAEELTAGTTTTRPTCQCVAGYYRPEGGYNFAVNLDCTAASHLYYVPEKGSSTQLVCPDGTNNIGTANTECGPCLLFDHFGYCWEPYTTILQTTDGVIRADEVTVSFDGLLRSGPQIQPFCDFIDYHGDSYECLRFPNCPKQGTCNIETLNLSSDLSCDRITSQTRCSDVQNIAQTYHPLFLVQTYDLHYCTANPSCSQFRIDPLLCSDCGSFCTTSYLKRKNFTDSSPDYDPTVLSYDEYMFEFTSLDCAELSNHAFLGVGSDFITPGNKFLHYWDAKWRGLSSGSFSTIALAGSNETVDWVRASNPRILLHHFWGDRQVGLEVSIGSILVRLLHNRVQVLKQDVVDTLIWERAISHLDTKTLQNSGLSKVLFETTDVTDGSFCSSSYQDGSCSATWTHLKSLSTFPVQFITSHIRPQDTSPTNTVKISFWDGELHDLPLNLSEFISLATQNSYRDNIQYSPPLKRYTGRSILISPVLDRRVLPPRSQDTSEYLCKESLLNNPDTTPVGAWLLQYYLMTDNIFTNFTRSYSDEIYRSLSGLVLDASNGLVTMSSNVYPDSIVALSQSLQCGDSEKSTLSGLYSDLQDVYTATSVSINSRLMSESSFYLNATLDTPDYYLRFRNIVNEQLNLLESTSQFLVGRVFSVYPKTNYSHPTGEFFIWRDVSSLYPAFDLGAGARPATLGTKHHFRSFTPHYLSIEGSNIKQAFLYYRQAVCSTGLRADCINDPTKWLTPEEQSKKGWEMWYHIFDDGSLDTLKIPLPLLPTDVYEVSLQVASVKTFRPNEQLYSNVQRFLNGEQYAQTQDTDRYRHSKLWNRLSIQKDILPASDFEVGVFDSNLDLDAKFLPSDSFARFETGEAASNSGFTFCMTYYPLTSQEPFFRIQNRLMNVRSGLPVKLQDGTESVLGYYAGAWDVVAQRARGGASQKLTCICYLSSGKVFLNGLSISDPSVVAPARVFLGDHLDIGTATYEPELALGPQGILLYTVGFWPSALDHDSIMKIQTDELRKHSATVVKSPLIDSFYAERHVRVSAIAETDASMPFYFRNFIQDVFFSHIDLALNPADFDPKLITENCEANGYECTFLYTRFDTSIPSLCVDGVDSSIYRPREMYGTCSSRDGILTSGGSTFISNNENTGIYRIYDGFYGPNYGLLLIANLVVNINAEFQPDFDSEIIFSNTMDFSLSRFDKETLAVRACGQHVGFKIPATGSAFEVEVKVSLNAGGDILVFWWDGKPIESFYFTRKHENNSRFVSYEKCMPSSGQFQMFRTQKRSNIGMSSFYAMSPYPTKSVGGIEMVDRHLQSFHIVGPDCRKKCVVYNQDPNTVTVDGEVVANIGEKKIRLLSKTHKNWALESDSFIGFVVRADPSFDTTEVDNVDFLGIEITLPFAHLVADQETTVLETIFLTISGTYETSPSLQVELRGGTPPFDKFRTREIYSERRSLLGISNQRNLQVEVKVRGNTFMLYLDGEEKHSMFIGKRFPLSELVIMSRKPYKFEDGLYEYSDFIILTKAHENCECRSDCAVATFASGGECLACPENTITFTSGATSINECVCKPLHKKNESGLCEPILHSTSLDNTPGYCTASSCALRSFMVGQQPGCSCTDDCFFETLEPGTLPCCANKCVTCPPSKNSAEGEYFSRNCKCEYDASQGVAVNRAGTTGCSGFVCGPGSEPLDGRCSACVENFYKVGVNLDFCVACEPCPDGYFRDGCGGSSSGVCLPCSTCGTGERMLQQCSTFSDTLCFDTVCDTTPPTSHLLGPFGLLVISSEANCIISPENRILECWGVSQYWDGSYQKESRLSIPMYSNMQPVDVQMGDDFICLLSLSGYVQCAGSNTNGRLGMAANVISVKLTDLENTKTINFGTDVFIVSMAVGSSHTCVLSGIGTVFCFGLNNHMQLGRPVDSSIQTPVDVGSAQIVLQVSCGFDYSCVRLQSGGVKCFGNWQNPGSGSLNRQFFLGDNLPELDLGTTSFAVDVQSSGSHTCVRFEDKTVKCFGQSGAYLGFDASAEASYGLSPQTMGTNLPALFGEETPIVQMALTPDSSCFLTANQRVICVGSYLFTGYYSDTPPHNNILTGRIQETWYLDFQGDRILSIFAFEQGEKNCAYTSSGKVYCWTVLLPSVILELNLPTELCAQGDYSTQCRTNDIYQLLFSRGFLTRRSPLGRRTAEEYGILTSCRQCTTSVEECAEGYFLSDNCDGAQASFKDNSCLPCSLFQCKDPGKYLTDEDCGVLTQNSTRFADSIECTGVCSQQEGSFLERGCNVL